LSLLVDRGRSMSRHLGVPLGGAADRAALALGNALVGSEPDAVALEVTLAGPVIEALHPTACVVFGGAFLSTINNHPIAPGTTFTLKPADVLRVGGTVSGARGYLCVAGGFTAPEVLGSRSALEPIRAGDELICRPSRIEPRSLPFVSILANPDREGRGGVPRIDRLPAPSESTAQAELRPLPHGRGLPVKLRVLDGPQRAWFIDDAFFTQEYEVLPASNRMGIRLKGAPLARRPGELVSEAVAPGAVQVTNDGLPVVLGVDGQTIGGYPKVAHVIRADLDLLAQLRPGERVRFDRVSPDDAERAANDRAAFLKEWLMRLRIADRQPEFG
jgi:antagonist of KipI